MALPPVRQQKQKSFAKMRDEESDLSLEVVILLIFGVFMPLFGLLLFRIHTRGLPYTPDSMYGLFPVLVSFQTITMGKTPSVDFRRSWMVIIIGICTSVIGMSTCFIPGPLTGPIRILVGLLLAVGGTALLFQLFVSEEKSRTCMKVPGILRHLTLAAGLVYVLTVISGLVTLLPGITTNPQTAVPSSSTVSVISISHGVSRRSGGSILRKFPKNLLRVHWIRMMPARNPVFPFSGKPTFPSRLQYSFSWLSSSPSLGSCSSP
jgi:hypothetical protein